MRTLAAILAMLAIVGCGVPVPSVSTTPLQVCSDAVSGSNYKGQMYCLDSKLYVQISGSGGYVVFPEGYHGQVETGLACAFTVGAPLDSTHCRVDDPNEYTK
jgi:hypothetical protein